MAPRTARENDEGVGNEDQTQDPGQGNLDQEDRRQDAGGATDDTGEEQTGRQPPGEVEDELDEFDVLDDDPEPPSRGAQNQRQPGRARQRIEALENELRDLRNNRQAPAAEPPRQQEETQQQFEARIAMLPPDERMEQRMLRSEHMNNQRLQIMQIQMADQQDRTAYQAKATIDKRFARYEQEVEQRLADLRRQGQNVSREALLKFIIGEKVLGNPAERVRARRQDAQRRVESQKTRPQNTRGDQEGANQRRQSGDSEREARRKRLENLTF
jgi:hypothetical protein